MPAWCSDRVRPVCPTWAPLVDGRLVTLSWTIDASRSIATEQVVEVGFAPGQTVVRLAVAAGATSLAVPGVPPGATTFASGP